MIGRSYLEIISRKEGEDKEREEYIVSNLSEVWRDNIELLGVSINIYMEIMRYYNRGKEHKKPWEDPNSELPNRYHRGVGESHNVV